MSKRDREGARLECQVDGLESLQRELEAMVKDIDAQIHTLRTERPNFTVHYAKYKNWLVAVSSDWQKHIDKVRLYDKAGPKEAMEHDEQLERRRSRY